MKRSARVALGGVIAALSIVLLLLGYIPAASMICPILAGFLLMLVYLHADMKTAVLVFITASVISFPTCDITVVLLYVLFFGYYPLLKSRLERIRFRPAEWILKLLTFNAGAAVYYLVLQYVLGIPMNISLFGIRSIWVLLIAANLVFLLYDRALSIFITRYKQTFFRRVGKF